MIRIIIIFIGLVFVVKNAIYSYPSASVITRNKSCLNCHVNNGEWQEDGTIIDIVDKETGKSLKQKDGTFLIEFKPEEIKTLLTILGRVKDEIDSPYRTGWAYVDPLEQEKASDSSQKFAKNWEVNLNLGCKLIGDKHPLYEGAKITVAPFTIKPTKDAKDAVIKLQAMLTKGESVKGKPKEGMLSNYFERTIYMKIISDKK